MLTVKRTVHKLDLRHPVIQEKLQFFLNQFKIAESELLINRRKTVTAGKRTSPAALIINNLVLKILQMFIYKSDLT